MRQPRGRLQPVRKNALDRANLRGHRMSKVPITDRTFPPTAWTAVLTARDPDAPTMREARETLCRVYWHLVAGYLQALGLTREQAEDSAQETMAALCSDGAAGRSSGVGSRLNRAAQV